MEDLLTADFSPFTTLSKKIQIQIFQNLSQEERQLKRLVCKAWNLIIRDEFQIELNIKTSNYERFLECTNAYKVILKSLMVEYTGKIGFGESLRILSVEGKVLTSNLIQILQQCPKIEVLIFQSLKQVLGIESMESIFLPKLLKIEIQVRFDQETFTSDELIIIHTLKTIKFGSLESLLITLTYPPRWSFLDNDNMSDDTSQASTMEESSNDFRAIPLDTDLSEVTATPLLVNPTLGSQDNPAETLNLRNSIQNETSTREESHPELSGERPEVTNFFYPGMASSDVSSNSEQQPASEISESVGMDSDTISSADNFQFPVHYMPETSQFEFARALINTRAEMPLVNSGADLETLLSNPYSTSRVYRGRNVINSASTGTASAFFELLLNNSDTIKTLSVKAKSEFMCFGNLSIHLKDLPKIQLQNVNYSFGRSQLCNEFMLLEAQRKLVKVSVQMSDDMWDSLMSAVAKSHQTLEELDVKILAFNEDPIDLYNISICQNLKLFKLFHFYEKSSVSELPMSLKTLLLHGPISLENMESLSSRLINLEEFTLIMNKKGGMINLNLFKSFVSLPKMIRLMFFDCTMDVNQVKEYCRENQELLEAKIQAPSEPHAHESFLSTYEFVSVKVKENFHRRENVS